MGLQGYRFEHPRDESRVIIIGGWSYLWAGLFGCLYVLAVGMKREVLKALLLDLVYLILFLGVVAASFSLPPLYQLLVVIVAIPGVTLFHGRALIHLVRDGYRRRGWRVVLE